MISTDNKRTGNFYSTYKMYDSQRNEIFKANN